MAQVIQAGPSGIGGGRGANLDQEVQGYLEQLNGLFAEDPSMKHRFPIEVGWLPPAPGLHVRSLTHTHTHTHTHVHEHAHARCRASRASWTPWSMA